MNNKLEVIGIDHGLVNDENNSLRYLSQVLRRLQQLRHFSVMYLSMKESSIRLEL